MRTFTALLFCWALIASTASAGDLYCDDKGWTAIEVTRNGYIEYGVGNNGLEPIQQCTWHEPDSNLAAICALVSKTYEKEPYEVTLEFRQSEPGWPLLRIDGELAYFHTDGHQAIMELHSCEE